MKKIQLVCVIEKNGKYHACHVPVQVGQNLKPILEGYPGPIVHICETATQAAYLAEEWNAAYKANGTYLFGSPLF